MILKSGLFYGKLLLYLCMKVITDMKWRFHDIKNLSLNLLQSCSFVSQSELHRVSIYQRQRLAVNHVIIRLWVELKYFLYSKNSRFSDNNNVTERISFGKHFYYMEVKKKRKIDKGYN